MAKLDKAQIAYAIGRVDQVGNTAYARINKEYSTPKADNATLAAALIAKGFVVADEYYLRGVSLKPTAADLKREAAKQKLIEAIQPAKDAAKDAIMLSDSEEVANVLANLAVTLAKLA